MKRSLGFARPERSRRFQTLRVDGQNALTPRRTQTLFSVQTYFHATATGSCPYPLSQLDNIRLPGTGTGADRLCIAGNLSLNTASLRCEKIDALPEVDSVCWYHRRFGVAAQKCSPTCKEHAKFKKKHQGNARAGHQ